MTDVVWVGRPAPHADFAHVPTLTLALGLTPLPRVLVLDPPEGEALEAWFDDTSRPSLSGVATVLVVDTVELPVLAASVRANVTCCLPRAANGADRALMIDAAKSIADQRRSRVSNDHGALRVGPTVMKSEWRVRTLDEAEALATVLAACCPCPERRVGGLLELLINAIEHGNLEITGPQKRALLMEGRWHDELLARLDDPRYAGRGVSVSFERRSGNELYITIEDDGAGFDFAEILRDSMDENFARHGRGIALARLMSFDDLRWEGRGNRVIGRISA
jgi:hypothetical protein